MKRYLYLIEQEIEKGMPVRELARKIKITATSILDYRGGTEPRQATLQKMAVFFCVPASALLLDVGDDNNYDDRIISMLPKLSAEKKKQLVELMEQMG